MNEPDEPFIREAKPTDVVKYAKLVAPRFFYGLVAEKHGQVIGMGAIVWGLKNRPYVCLDISEELRKHPMLIWRVGYALTQAGIKVCGKIYTMQGDDEPTSARLLKRLGYIPTGEVLNGEQVLVNSGEQSCPK